MGLAVAFQAPFLLPLVLLSSVLRSSTKAPQHWALSQVRGIMMKMSSKWQSRVAEEIENRVQVVATKRENQFDQISEQMIFGDYYPGTYWCGSVSRCEVLASPLMVLSACSKMLALWMVKQQGGGVAEAMGLFTLLGKLTAQENQAHSTFANVSSTLKMYDMFTDFVNTPHIDDESKGIDAPPDWPSRGQIEFRNIVYRYGPHMPIAFQIENLKIEAGWKVGIVGPPGAGKSTLLNLLFRLFPLKGVAPKSGGVVTIDGVDIATLKLDTLRSAVGVVPQEPVIFTGTLKENLMRDPTVSDTVLASVLSSVGLNHLASADRLASAESLSKLSVGSRQLLATARVLARQPKVIVFDEATSNLGQSESDKLLDVITNTTGNATVISIAHRLGVVMNCDR